MEKQCEKELILGEIGKEDVYQEKLECGSKCGRGVGSIEREKEAGRRHMDWFLGNKDWENGS